jgi:hypothetical protein
MTEKVIPLRLGNGDEERNLETPVFFCRVEGVGKRDPDIA